MLINVMVYPSNIINTKYLIQFLEILHIFYPTRNNSKPNTQYCPYLFVKIRKQYLVLAVFQLPVTLHNKLLTILGIVFVSMALATPQNSLKVKY